MLLKKSVHKYSVEVEVKVSVVDGKPNLNEFNFRREVSFVMELCITIKIGQI